MKPIIALTVLSLAASSAVFGAPAAEKSPDGYAFIKSIRSPQEMLFPHFPRKYCVPVTLTGRIADEMKVSLDSLHMELPKYNEAFDGSAFHLILANPEYAARTRELLSGILNPVEIIDMVVTSVVKYREGRKFEEIRRDTRLQRDTATFNGRPATVLRLTPRGERFAYVFQDMGAFVNESWLTMLTITIDAATNIVLDLSTIRYSRTYDASAAEKPAPDLVNAHYVFFYDQQEGKLLPKRLIVEFNSSEVLRIDATYRKKGDLFVFDRKEICTTLGGIPACLIETYGEYVYAGCDTSRLAPRLSDKNLSKKLEKASSLAQEASDRLRKGQISDAARLLQKLVDQYGDTPQAVEARRLLNRLPKELQ